MHKNNVKDFIPFCRLDRYTHVCIYKYIMSVNAGIRISSTYGFSVDMDTVSLSYHKAKEYPEDFDIATLIIISKEDQYKITTKYTDSDNCTYYLNEKGFTIDYTELTDSQFLHAMKNAALDSNYRS